MRDLKVTVLIEVRIESPCVFSRNLSALISQFQRLHFWPLCTFSAKKITPPLPLSGVILYKRKSQVETFYDAKRAGKICSK